MVIHSKDDAIVQGQNLFAAANEPKLFLETSGTHNAAFTQSYGLYLRAIKAFLQADTQ